MLSSVEYFEKVEKYKEARRKILDLISSFGGLGIGISVGYLKNLNINGKQIDDGDLSLLGISNELSSIKSDLNSIVFECNQKIIMYTKLANEAKRREIFKFFNNDNDDNNDMEMYQC